MRKGVDRWQSPDDYQYGGREGRSWSRGRDSGSPRDEGRLLALQDHLTDMANRLARAEKQRQNQPKEASRSLNFFLWSL